ncbi:MAG: hypothetical protein V1773_12915 [bacterium]
MKNYIILLLSFVLILIGCADQIVSDCDSIQIQVLPEGTTFAQIQNEVFSTNCALSGCHGTNSPQADLDLSSGNAYVNLVNVQSVLYPSLKRIVPGNSSQSLLIKALKGEDAPLMPSSGKLPNSVIDSIAAWIDRGAVNN